MISYQSEIITPASSAWIESLQLMHHDIYHTPNYTAVCAAEEKGEPYAFLYRSNDGAFFLPFLQRRIILAECTPTHWSDATSVYGYPGPLMFAHSNDPLFYREAISQLVEALVGRGIVSLFVRMHTLLSDTLRPFLRIGQLVSHGNTVSIDLTLSEREMWSQVRRDHRNQINKARRLGHQSEFDEKGQYWNEFLDIYAESMVRVDATRFYHFPRSYFDALRSELGDRLHLFVTRIDGEIAAASLFTECDGIVQYHLAGTRSAYMHLRPSKLLIYDAALWAKARGNRVLHLGGGLGAKEDSLFEFKAGFSKRTHPFSTWRVIVDPPTYESLVRDWELQSGSIADPGDGFFPAYRKPIP